MKHLISVCAIIIFCGFSSIVCLGQAIKVNSTGQVGINGEPSTAYSLKVNGTLSATYLTTNQLLVGSLSLTGWNLYADYLYIGHGSSHISIGGGYRDNSALKVAGENTQYALDIEGNLHIEGNITHIGTGPWVLSDGKTKKSIVEYKDPNFSNKLMRVQVKEYQYKNAAELTDLYNQGLAKFPTDTITSIDKQTGEIVKKVKLRIPKCPQGKQRGLIAEDLKDIFPELVKLDEATQLYAVNYNGFIPILIEAYKEQQQKIDALEQRLAVLEAKLKSK